MNMKKTWKRFFSLNRHHAEGFTLVELIVVIAILAILGGVAVPAYSGYVEKANMQADISLASEVAHALTLAYYSNPDSFSSGVVTLSNASAPDCGGNAVLEDAMAKAFGEGWKDREDLWLKHNGWSDTFQDSNFYDDQNGLSQLMGTVDTLTDALGAALENTTISDALTNGAFSAYVDNLDADTTAKKADAAVFYVADTTGKVSAEDLQGATNAMLDAMYAGGGADDCLVAMNGKLNSTLASTAALYALAQGYANYYDANYETPAGQKSPSDILSETTAGFTNTDGTTTLASAADAYTKLMAGFQQMGGVSDTALKDYMENYMAADINAYAEAMKMVSASKDSILENNGELGTSGYFSTSYVSNMVSSYADGSVFVYALKKDGTISVTSSILAID